MLNYILAASSIDKIAGLFPTYFVSLFFITGLLGFVFLIKNKSISKSAWYLILLMPFVYMSGFGYGFKIEIILRAAQLTFTILTYIYIVHKMNADNIARIFIMLVPVMIIVFCFEVFVKSDLRNAFLSIDLNYFANSGGTDFYVESTGRGSGVQIFSQGNVFAAAISGITAIVCYFFGRQGLALFPLFFCIATGSRSLLVAIFCISFLVVVWKFIPYLRQYALRCFVILLMLQPMIYINIHWLLSDDLNEILFNLSPRYVSFVAYGNMGMENLFGVGWFQGKYFEDFFFARWPIPAHNIFMSVFGELGVIAYIIWCGFVWNLTDVIRKNIYASIVFVYTLTMFTFIGGFNEWSFWIPLALAVRLSLDDFSRKKWLVLNAA